MSFVELRRRLGLGGEPADARLAWRVLGAVLLLYSAAFFVFYPSVITNDDESIYVDQARNLAEGRTTVPKLDPVTGEDRAFRNDYYPVGTALLMAPFVALAGWQAAYLVPWLCFVLAALLLARWLHQDGRSPLFALLMIGFPAALVMGRVAMSDVPNMAVVTLALWLFWRRQGASRGDWLASGFVAGCSLLFRDTNAVLFAPLYIGTVLRREGNWPALLVGGLAGVAVKLGAAWLALGDPLYLRSEYVVEFGSLGTRLAIQLVGLVVLVPGGLVVALCYRGRRWPEVCAAIVLFLVFFVIQKHTTYASGLSKRLILDWRYVLAVVPLIVFAMGEALPRLWRAAVARTPASGRSRLTAAAAAAVGLLAVYVASLSVGVHWAFDRWSQTQARIRDTIHQHTGDDSVVITNRLTTRKFLRNLERPYLYVDRDVISSEDAEALRERYEDVFLVFLDRSDTAHRQLDSDANQAFVDSITGPLEVVFDQELSSTERLRIWRLPPARGG